MFTLKSKTDNVKNTNEGKPMDRNIKKLENLDYWFTLSRVAALGSMNKAAEELNIDVSSVSNKIRVLEKALGEFSQPFERCSQVFERPLS